jgi:hypothetical protein
MPALCSGGLCGERTYVARGAARVSVRGGRPSDASDGRSWPARIRAWSGATRWDISHGSGWEYVNQTSCIRGGARAETSIGLVGSFRRATGATVRWTGRSRIGRGMVGHRYGVLLSGDVDATSVRCVVQFGGRRRLW